MFEAYYWSLVAGVPVLGSILGFVSRPKKTLMTAVKNVKPPNWVFSVAWPVLYIMYGLAWSFALEDPPCDLRIASKEYVAWTAYSITLALLYSWSFVFNESVQWSMVVLLLAFVGVLMCYSISPMASKLLLSPLIVWLYFAGMLNYTIVEKS
jgi:tryptophan-rich sensory protein